MGLFKKEPKIEVASAPTMQEQQQAMMQQQRNSEIQTTVQLAMNVYSTMFARTGTMTHEQLAAKAFDAAEAFVAVLKTWKLPSERAAEEAEAKRRKRAEDGKKNA